MYMYVCVCVEGGLLAPQLLRFSGVALGEACTVVIRGATQQILDEADRSLHDALCVLQQTVKETRIVYGGGTCISCVCVCEVKPMWGSLCFQPETMDYTYIVHGFWPKSENFDFGKTGYHRKGYLKRSRMVQISAS